MSMAISVAGALRHCRFAYAAYFGIREALDTALIPRPMRIYLALFQLRLPVAHRTHTGRQTKTYLSNVVDIIALAGAAYCTPICTSYFALFTITQPLTMPIL
jgi:hypothetical protein